MVIYALSQYLLAARCCFIACPQKAKWPGYVAVALALLPLLAAKFLPANAAVGAAAAGPPVAAGAFGLVEFLGLSYATLRVVDVLIGIHDGLITVLPAGPFLRVPAVLSHGFLGTD